MSWRHTLMVLARSSEELCGLLYGDKPIIIDNVAQHRCVEYAMDVAQQVEVMKLRGWPDAVWHTHPAGTRQPSTIDLETMPEGWRMIIAAWGWMGTWLNGQQVQEALMGELTTDIVEVFQGQDERWRWHRIANNGAIISTSGEDFDSKGNAARAANRANPDIESSTAEAPVAGGTPDFNAPTTAGTEPGPAVGPNTGTGPTPPATTPPL